MSDKTKEEWVTIDVLRCSSFGNVAVYMNDHRVSGTKTVRGRVIHSFMALRRDVLEALEQHGVVDE